MSTKKGKKKADITPSSAAQFIANSAMQKSKEIEEAELVQLRQEIEEEQQKKVCIYINLAHFDHNHRINGLPKSPSAP